MKKKIFIVIMLLFLVCGCGKKKEDIKSLTYEVTIKDSENILSKKSLRNGDLLEQPEDPVKDGYAFVRWVVDCETFDFSKPIIKDVVIEAEWRLLETEETVYIVKFDSKGGLTIENQIVKEGDNIIKPSNPVNSGYTFVEWKLDGKTYDFSNSVNSDLILIANWKSNPKK